MDVQMKPEPVSSSSSSSSSPCTLDSELETIASSPQMNSNNNNNKSNAPDPELMAKLSDALAVLPKEIQEMLVNRLISTITSSDALKAHVDQVTQAQAAAATIPNVAIPSTTTSSTAATTTSSKPLSATTTPIEPNPEVLPLAA